MCNLADRIEEKALEKGKKIGIEQGIEQGIKREKIQSVVTLIQNSHLSFDEVIKLLNVPDSLIETCRECVSNI